MPTLEEWIECRDGLPQETCEKYRRWAARKEQESHAQKAAADRKSRNPPSAIGRFPQRTTKSSDSTSKTKKRITDSRLKCLARGEVIRKDVSNLCGMRGQAIEIHACAKYGECSLGRYCKDQAVRTCTMCVFANEHDPPPEACE